MLTPEKIIRQFSLNDAHTETLVKEFEPYYTELVKLSHSLGCNEINQYNFDENNHNSEWSTFNSDIDTKNLQFAFEVKSGNFLDPLTKKWAFRNLISVSYILRSECNENFNDNYKYDIAFFITDEKNSHLKCFVNKMEFNLLSTLRFQAVNLQIRPAYKAVDSYLNMKEADCDKLHNAETPEEFISDLENEINRLEDFKKLLKTIKAKIKLLNI